MSEATYELGDAQVEIHDLEARVGRQAILIESLQNDLTQAHADYTKLIGVVAQLVNGDITLDRFKILPDGLSWQVLALPVAKHESYVVPDCGENISPETHPRPE